MPEAMLANTSRKGRLYCWYLYLLLFSMELLALNAVASPCEAFLRSIPNTRRGRRLPYLRCCILDQWECRNGVLHCRQENTPLLSYLAPGRVARLGDPPSKSKGNKHCSQLLAQGSIPRL
ncbi:hypothetical protein NDU88_004161 [Pleurodeles waltl]|uniref:Uncharacterized protein n=1 Tax=Pleurodeles waltl TaxID=8319 RepID=A0AAV7SHZ1_PLEWA|nr:hypothetical protein NDU88_004161 [Pleurodeles waltl]